MTCLKDNFGSLNSCTVYRLLDLAAFVVHFIPRFISLPNFNPLRGLSHS